MTPLLNAITTTTEPTTGTMHTITRGAYKSSDARDEDLTELLKAACREELTKRVLDCAQLANHTEQGGIDAWTRARTRGPWTHAVLQSEYHALLRSQARVVEGSEDILDGITVHESHLLPRTGPQEVTSMLLNEGAIGLYVGDWGIEDLEDRIIVRVNAAVLLLDRTKIVGIEHHAHVLRAA